MTVKSKKHHGTEWTGKRILVSVVAALLALLMVLPMVAEIVVYGSAITQEDIDALKAEKSAIANEQAKAQKVLNDLKEQENSAMERLQALDTQIGLLSDQINATQAIIDDYEVMIAQTQRELEQAKEEESHYYELFLSRVRAMEEEGVVSYWEILFQAASFSDLLDRINFVNDVMQYDNDVMDKLQAARNAVAAAEEQLIAEQKQQEEAKAQLEDEQAQLEIAAEEEEKVLAEILENEEIYAEQIAELASAQEVLVGEISAAEAQLAAEEAARALEEQRRREEEERRRQEEEERRQQELENAGNADEDTGDDDMEVDGGNDFVPPADDSDIPGNEDSGSSGGSSGGGRNPAASLSGSSIIGYASQFVGNPYVWGGNSLTNGIDCSGFVHQVLKHFGYSAPRQSAVFRSYAKAVDVENMQVGDIVCYSGHVGFYAGNGMLLSALGKDYGITYCSVYYKPILAVRRV